MGENKTYSVVETVDNEEYLLFTGDKVKATEYILSNYNEKDFEKGNKSVALKCGFRTKWSSVLDSFKGLIHYAIPDALAQEKGIVMPFINDINVPIVNIDKKKLKVVETNKILETAREIGLIGTIPAKETNNLGDIYISAESVYEFANITKFDCSRDRSTHFSVLCSLVDIIKSSILVEIHPDCFKNENGKRAIENGYSNNVTMLRAYSAVKLKGEDEILRTKITLKQLIYENIGKKVYNYEVVKVDISESEDKKINRISTIKGQSLLGSPTPQLSLEDSISLAKLLNGVEKSYDGGKKVLNESKNSLAEYEKETNLVVKEYIKMNGFLRDRKVEEKCVEAKNLCEMFAKQMNSSTELMKGIGGIRMVDTDLKIKDDKEEIESQNKSKGRRR